MPSSQKIDLLKKAANTDDQLLQAWTAVETIVLHCSAPGTATTYEKYLEHLVLHSEKQEESGVGNSSCRVNVVETNSAESYLPCDTHYEDATDLAAYRYDSFDVGMQSSATQQQTAPKTKIKMSKKTQPSRVTNKRTIEG